MEPTFDTHAVHAALLPDLCPVVPGATVSKPLVNTPSLRQVLFSMDAEQEMSDHKAPFVATVQIITGRLTFTVDGASHDMRPGSWLLMPPNALHALKAVEPTIFLLTLVKGDAA